MVARLVVPTRFKPESENRPAELPEGRTTSVPSRAICHGFTSGNDHHRDMVTAPKAPEPQSTAAHVCLLSDASSHSRQRVTQLAGVLDGVHVDSEPNLVSTLVWCEERHG